MSIYKSCRKTCPDYIVNDFVTNYIKTVPLRTGYATIRVTLKTDKVSDKTLTYCDLTTVSVVCRKGCLVDIIDVGVKSAPRNNKLREVIPMQELFKREVFFYQEILKELGEFSGVPTLVASNVEEGAEAIILQNLGTGWVGELTQEHVSLVLKEFAKLHALWYSYIRKKPQKVEEFRKELSGGLFSTLQNGKTVKIVKENVRKLLECVEGEAAKKLEHFARDVETYLANVFNESSTIDVLVHGDPTTSFKFVTEKSETRAKISDWQLVKLGSPVLDLSLFLFTNCDDFTRIHHLLEEYHNHLTTCAEEFHYSINEIFPFKVLQDHWKKYAKYGFALTILALKVVTLPVNKRPNANNEDLTVEEFVEGFIGPPNEEFVWRMKEVVKYCINEELI